MVYIIHLVILVRKFYNFQTLKIDELLRTDFPNSPSNLE